MLTTDLNWLDLSMKSKHQTVLGEYCVKLCVSICVYMHGLIRKQFKSILVINSHTVFFPILRFMGQSTRTHTQTHSLCGLINVNFANVQLVFGVFVCAAACSVWNMVPILSVFDANLFHSLKTFNTLSFFSHKTNTDMPNVK